MFIDIGQTSDYKIKGNENGIPFRWDTTIYWFQLILSAAYVLCVFKLRYNKNCPFLTQSQNSYSQELCIFWCDVYCDVNVRGGYRHTGNRYWSKVDNVLASKRELSPKTIDIPVMLVKCLF